MDNLYYKPIGIIYSPFKDTIGTPIQSAAGAGIEGKVEIFPEFAEGLTDIDSFSHIMLIYNLHLSKKGSLIVKPFLDTKIHGIFATRSPSRPNPIGISVVRLIKREKNILHIQDMDIINGTPLLDIKPYVPEFDVKEVESIGWYDKNISKLNTMKDDGRFSK